MSDNDNLHYTLESMYDDDDQQNPIYVDANKHLTYTDSPQIEPSEVSPALLMNHDEGTSYFDEYTAWKERKYGENEFEFGDDNDLFGNFYPQNIIQLPSLPSSKDVLEAALVLFNVIMLNLFDLFKIILYVIVFPEIAFKYSLNILHEIFQIIRETPSNLSYLNEKLSSVYSEQASYLLSSSDNDNDEQCFSESIDSSLHSRVKLALEHKLLLKHNLLFFFGISLCLLSFIVYLIILTGFRVLNDSIIRKFLYSERKMV